MAIKNPTYYTYLIGWSQHDIWYYGSKYSKDADPELFWKKYPTSSKHVAKFREQHGEPDVIQIRRTFSCPKKTLAWESKVHKRMNCRRDLRWLNRAVANEKWSTAGMTSVVDADGNTMIVDKNHPKVLSEEWKSVNDGRVWYNNGVECKMFHDGHQPEGWILGNLRKPYNKNGKVKYYIPGSEPSGWQRGDLQHLKPRTVYYNNGVNQKRFEPGKQPDGFIPGRIQKSVPDKWYNNGVDSHQFPLDQQPAGWVEGRIMSQKVKDMRVYNNGVIEKKFLPGVEPEGFVRGRLKTDCWRGKRTYNNGVQNKSFIPGTEPEGWMPGEKPRKRSGKKQYNNGEIARGFIPGTEPNRWILGGLPKEYTPGTKWYTNGIEESRYRAGKQPEGWALGRLSVTDK